jgi:hypothetical protein
MNDIFFLTVLAAFAAASWGLVILCDRLAGGER